MNVGTQSARPIEFICKETTVQNVMYVFLCPKVAQPVANLPVYIVSKQHLRYAVNVPIKGESVFVDLHPNLTRDLH